MQKQEKVDRDSVSTFRDASNALGVSLPHPRFYSQK